MKYDVLLKKLTRLCGEMVSAGGSSELIPLRMNYICNSYGLTESEFIVNPNGIMATATSPDGTNLTAIRSINGIGQNFGKLSNLDKYCRVIIETLPEAEEIDKALDSICSAVYLKLLTQYIASIFLGTSFAILFGASLTDIPVAIIACILVVFIGSIIKKRTTNIFFYNAVICLVVESFILFCSRTLNICSRPESVSLGYIMLLISGLSFSEGLWSMINKESTIGIYKLNSAIIGAIGIVIGTATPLLLAGNVTVHGLSSSDPIIIQFIACMLACGGFAALCSVEKRHLFIAALGAGICWLSCTLMEKLVPSTFVCNAVATFVLCLYVLLISWKFKVLHGIVRVVGILPLVPGSKLFYMLYGITSHDYDLAATSAMQAITICLGISFGFALGSLFINFDKMKIKENAQ